MIIAMTPTRGDEWILPLNLHCTLDWADRQLICVHQTDDGQYLGKVMGMIGDLPADKRDRVDLISIKDPVWNEMAHRQAMLEAARHFAGGSPLRACIVDADEIIYDPTGDMRTIMPNPGEICWMPLYNLRGGWKYHDNGIWGNRIVSVMLGDDGKVFYGGDTFHRREPRGSKQIDAALRGVCGLRCLHLWGFSERRLRAKHCLYELVEATRWPNKSREEIDKMYHLSVNGDVTRPASMWRFSDVPQTWFPDHLRAMVGGDDDIWQEAEIARLLEKNGRAYFDGLDLFGY